MLVIVIGATLVYVNFFWSQNVNDKYPIPEITIKPDSAMLAHGEYLVNGPAHCVGCHIPIEQLPEIAKGEKLPLVGGFEFNLPLGILRTPNITPDTETGIGRYTDGQFRSGRTHPTSPMPWESFQRMDDTDLKAIYRFLTSVPPVENEISMIAIPPVQ